MCVRVCVFVHIPMISSLKLALIIEKPHKEKINMCKSNEIILDIVTAGSRYHSASHHANVERGRGKVFCVSGMLRVGGGSSLPAGGGE